MSTNPTMGEIIASALSLPMEERLVVIDAIHGSLADPVVNHGGSEDPMEVHAAWSEEIARRIREMESGRAVTFPAEEAERLIGSHAKPSL